MHITLREDYPLKGDITKFETYMFMTTKKFIEEHSEFPHEKFYVNSILFMTLLAERMLSIISMSI